MREQNARTTASSIPLHTITLGPGPQRIRTEKPPRKSAAKKRYETVFEYLNALLRETTNSVSLRLYTVTDSKYVAPGFRLINLEIKRRI